MTSHNNFQPLRQGLIREDESMDHRQNKVYVNRNFKRGSTALPHTSSMYINPNFALAPKVQSKMKIYLNPNFIRPNNTLAQHQAPAKYETSTGSQSNIIPTLLENNITPQITRSRYSIVRYKNDTKVTETHSLHKVTTTFKIGKYKSVPITDIKQSLDRIKKIDKTCKLNPQLLTRYKKCIASPMPNSFNSRYKIVKRNLETRINPDVKSPVIRKLSISLSKNALQSNHRTKIKINKKHYKKNNIPCPLFRKYGKCLRNCQGNCEFLHDKKHVSICRRFLNGTCYDNECLLSHDLTKKKMPTCSFYLKGMCTKEGCPYLHVKLNEKTKICTDFLKGYCEKGDNCLNRHINICPDMATKGVCSKNQCPHQHKNVMKTTKSKKIIMKTNALNRSNKPTLMKRISKYENGDNNSVIDKTIVECRYYKEVTNDIGSSETCEILKPTRCKLGTLPSFIQL